MLVWLCEGQLKPLRGETQIAVCDFRLALPLSYPALLLPLGIDEYCRPFILG